MSTSNCITLHLTRKLETRIDSIDSELAQHKWYASDNKYGYHYAVRAISIGAGGQVMSLELQPISFSEACQFIDENHSHHKPPQGWKFGIAVNDGEKIVGVVTVGRPVARHLDDSWTLEVTRCCTDGTKNVASMLYGAAARAAKALGYKRLITYTLKEEHGTSLKAAGWTALYDTRPQSWDRPNRKRIDKHPTGQKTLWEA